MSTTMYNGTQNSTHESTIFFQKPTYDSFLILLAVSIVAINIVVIVLFIRKDYLRTKTNTFLISLALSDLMTGLLSIPFYLICIDVNQYVCLASGAFYRCIAVSTMAHILVVTLERYIAVMYPMRYYRVVTTRRVCITIGVVWAFSIFYAVIQFAWLDVAGYELFTDTTGIGEKEKYERIYHITGLVVCFALPLLAMIVCFTRMFIVIRRQVKNIRKQAEMTADPRNKSIATDKRALVIFATMLGIFFVCWLSFYISLMQYELDETVIFPDTLADILDFFRFGTSLFNPLLYTFLKHDFRRALRSMCDCFQKSTDFVPRRDSTALRMTLSSEANGKLCPPSPKGRSLSVERSGETFLSRDSREMKVQEIVQLISPV